VKVPRAVLTLGRDELYVYTHLRSRARFDRLAARGHLWIRSQLHMNPSTFFRALERLIEAGHIRTNTSARTDIWTITDDDGPTP